MALAISFDPWLKAKPAAVKTCIQLKRMKVARYAPFCIKYTDGDKKLTFIGVNHTSDKSSKTYKLIKKSPSHLTGTI